VRKPRQSASAAGDQDGQLNVQPPPPALRGAVACLWTSLTPEHADHDSHAGLVLPDACSDLIWEQGVGCHIAARTPGPPAP
jgi:hypothetical protein